jgi:dihydroorotate dehydrogenase (fumarate)
MILMNASGCYCTTKEELFDLYRNDYCSMVVSKSCTVKPRDGNPEPRYYDENNFSINSTGLRNKGLFYYLSMIPFFNIYNKFNNITNPKKYIISFADLANIDFFIYHIQQHYKKYEFDLNFELNLSCPNIPGKGQIGYDFDETNKLLNKVFSNIDQQLINNKHINIGVKLPPYFDTIHFNQIADVLNQYPLSHVTCINSLGNGFVFNNKNNKNNEMEQSIAGNGGYGGIGGSIIKPFGLSNVRKLNELLNGNISLYGCGGIINGKDVYEYEKCGASVVQIGTELYKHGPDIFETIYNDYMQIVLYNYFLSSDLKEQQKNSRTVLV